MMSAAIFAAMCLLLFALAISLLLSVGGSLSDPTPEEIQLGFEVPPPLSWGHQARTQNSMRVLSIGGSNTAACVNFGGYVDNLRNAVKEGDIKNDSAFKNSSIVINYGFSGFGPSIYTGKKMAFEETTPVALWPNIVIVDCSVNMSPDAEGTIRELDKLVQFLAWKWHGRGLPTPDILFYNMPHLKNLYRMLEEKPMEDRKDREAYVAQYSFIRDVFVNDETIRQFAKHYHFPVVSFGNATYAAGLRHFVEFGSMTKPKWPYSDDGIHMSCLPGNGTRFGREKLLVPFFRAVMAPRQSNVDNKLVDYGVTVDRLVPSGPLLIETVSYFAGLNAHSTNDLEEAFLSHSEWRRIQLNHGEYCIGSRNASAVGEATVFIPSDCTKERGCRLQLTFLRSWNVSYVGNASCSVHYHPNRDHAGVRLTSLHIDGQEGNQKATIPVKSEFDVNVTAGHHTIKCVNLIQDRLSCMFGIHVNTVIVI